MRKQDQHQAADERLFRSYDGEDIRVTLDDGSVAVVGATPRTLPRKFWRQAIKQGCQTGDIKPAELPPMTPADEADTRRAEIVKAILEALDSDEADPAFADAFTAAGVPNVRWLEKRVKFNLSAEERDHAWAEVQADKDSNDNESDED